MRKPTHYSIVMFLLPLLFVVGCAAPVSEQENNGFLSDYSKLEKTDDSAYTYESSDLANYSSFIIDPIAILFKQDATNPDFDQAELDELNAYIVAQMTEALTEDGAYKVVSEPAAGVARIRLGITDLDATDGALNVVWYTKVTGAGLGGIATETEMVDSVTGKQITAGIRWGSGSRVLRAGFTHTGDAKILVNRWIKAGREMLDSAHGVNK